MTPIADHSDQNTKNNTQEAHHSAEPMKPRITIFTRSYPPAYLSGGPARSVHALVEALTKEFTFSVVTSAVDDSTAGPMHFIEQNRWTHSGQTAVWYDFSNRIPARRTGRLLRETRPQLIYLNSLFDFRFAILPLLIARTTSWRVPVLLAPRGELSPGGLALKQRKKRTFIAAFRMLRLHKSITWHASTDQELSDIHRVFGCNVRSHIAIDLRTGISGSGADREERQPIPDDPPGGSLVFFSRIVPKKNVAAAIQAVSLVKENVRLSIAGPIEDSQYWDHCLAIISNMPNSGLVRYVGTVPADAAVDFLNRFDLFVFPTLGENFGHVVLESLAAGTPVIVGTDTPWRRIETLGAGWTCDPTAPTEIARLIERFLCLDEDARGHMRVAARKLASEMLNDPTSVHSNGSMFHSLVSVHTDESASTPYYSSGRS